MLITEKSFISCSLSHLPSKRNGRKFRPIWAKKPDLTENLRITEKSFISCSLSYLPSKRNGRKSRPIWAKKPDLTENLKTRLGLRSSNVLLARAGIAVFALGFIDAGYSGDWSRIGVISREGEELLKIAAFLVVPLCLFLMFSFSNEEEA